MARYYFRQPPALLRWALTNPPTRVIYSRLTPRKADFDLVRELMMETGVLDKKIEFEDYCRHPLRGDRHLPDSLVLRGGRGSGRVALGPDGKACKGGEGKPLR